MKHWRVRNESTFCFTHSFTALWNGQRNKRICFVSTIADVSKLRLFIKRYGALKVEAGLCEKCGRKTRDLARRGKIFPYPKSLRENTVCKSCFFKGHHEDDVKKYTEHLDEKLEVKE